MKSTMKISPWRLSISVLLTILLVVPMQTGFSAYAEEIVVKSDGVTAVYYESVESPPVVYQVVPDDVAPEVTSPKVSISANTPQKNTTQNTPIISYGEEFIGVSPLDADGEARCSDDEELVAALQDQEVGTIYLTQANYLLPGYFYIQRDITFIAEAGSATIKSAEGATRHFVVAAPNATLTFEKVTLEGTSTGGGILLAPSSIAATLTLNGAKIINCNSSDKGGAVMTGEFEKNHSLILNECEISHNTAKSNGGGVYGYGAITLNNCIISNNTSTHEQGGGVYSFTGPLTINGGSLNYNTAAFKGGAVDVGTAQTPIKDSPEATEPPVDTMNCIITGEVEIIGNAISEEAGAAGSAIYAGKDIIVTGNVAVINNSLPKGSWGGVFHAAWGDVKITSDNSVFKDNLNTAIYTPVVNLPAADQVTQVNIAGNVTFDNNAAAINSMHINLSGNVVIKNHKSGTALSANSRGSLTRVRNGDYTPSADYLPGKLVINGGEIRDNGSEDQDFRAFHSVGSAEITNCLFTNNQSKGEATLGCCNGPLGSTALSLVNCKIIQNENHIDPTFLGALFVNRGDLVRLSDSVFEGNFCTDDGSLVTWNEMEVSNCTFKNNTARTGAAFTSWNENNKRSTISNSSFIDNTVRVKGVIRVGNNVEISDCVFKDNESFLEPHEDDPGHHGQSIDSPAGGAITIHPYDEATGSIENCLFENNTAGWGGAICLQFVTTNTIRTATFTISNSIFNDNSSTKSGGAIYFDGSLTVSGCEFNGNRSVSGGAIALKDQREDPEKNSYKIENSSFTKNIASRKGGALHAFTYIHIKDSAFVANEAHIANGGAGGAILSYWYGLTTDGVTFSNNYAPNTFTWITPELQDTYDANILNTVSFTAPFTQGYNNADIDFFANEPSIVYHRNYDLEDANTVSDGPATPGEALSDLFTTTDVEAFGWNRDLCIFAGWSTNPDGTGEIPETMPNEALHLYAIWKTSVIDIDYDLNDSPEYPATAFTPAAGSTTAIFKSTVGSTPSELDAVVEPGSPTRVGYEFVGWFDTPEKAQAPLSNLAWNFASDTVSDESSAATNTKTFYAGWTAKSNNVKYEYANEKPVDAPDAEAFNHEANFGEIVAVKNSPEVTGYTFSGWTTQDDVSMQTDPNTETSTFTMPDKEVVFQGSWTKNIYTISYEFIDAPLGVEALLPPSVEGVEYGTEGITVAQYPVFEGYTFGGWYTEDAIVTANTFTMPAGNVHFVGSWVAGTATPYTVEHYHVNAQGVADSLPFETYEGFGTTNTLATATPKTNLVGYEFDENHPDNLLSATITGDGKLVLRLYYQVKSHSVSYIYTGNNYPEDVPALPFGMSVAFGTEVPIADDPTYKGFKFNGWVSESAGVNITADSTAFTMPDNLVVLQGSWAPQDVLVVFDPNSGVVGNTTSLTADYGTILADRLPTTLPDIPTKQGYVFDGWSLLTGDNAASNRFEASIPLTDGNGVQDVEGDNPTLTLYAVWLPAEIAITYIYEDDVEYTNQNTTNTFATKVEQGLYDEYLDYSPTPNPIKEGHNFIGWFTQPEANGVQWAFGQPISSPTTLTAENGVDTDAKTLTLYAAWEPKIYTITYEPGMGEGSSYNEEVYFGDYYSIIDCPFYCSNHGFYAWQSVATEKYPSKYYYPGDTFSPWEHTEDLVLIAQWEHNPIFVTASYNYSGIIPPGAPVEPGLQDYLTPGDWASVAPNPTMLGYTFSGWTSDEVYVEDYGFFSVPWSNVDFYGFWTAQPVRVQFFNNYNGATSEHYAPAEALNASKAYGQTVANSFTPPTRAGYTFDGWHKEAACENVWNFATSLTVPNGLVEDGEERFALSLFAKWIPTNIAITYDTNGSTEHYDVAPGSDSALFDHFVGSTSENPSRSIAPASPSHLGYTFKGWFDTSAKAADPTNNTPWNFTTDTVSDEAAATSGEKTFFAGWEENRHAVRYQYLGDVPPGIPAPELFNQENVAYGTTVTLAERPVVVGYTFAGWTSPDAPIGIDEFVMPDNDVVLTGTWTIQSFNVSYSYKDDVPAGAETLLPPDEPGVVFGTLKQLPAAPSLPGYTFVGWSSADVSINNNSYTMPARDVSFTGRWVPGTATAYTVEHHEVYPGGYISVTPFETERLAGTTNERVYATPRTNVEGFTFDPDYPENIPSGIISADGLLVLKLYYPVNENKVTYAYQGNTPQGAPSLPQEVSVPYGVSVTVAENPTLKGYTFSRWNPANSSLAISNNAFTMPDYQVVLQGSWTAKRLTVLFNENTGVQGSITSLTADYASTLGNRLPAMGSDIPTKEGYVFGGWSVVGGDNETEQRFVASTTLIESNGVVGADGANPTLTLYAVWVPAEIDITYIYDGRTEYTNQNSSNTPASKIGQGVYGGTISRTPNPVPEKTGYTFGGWYTGAAGTGSEWTFGNKASGATSLTKENGVDTTANKLTLYALWIPEGISVSFFNNYSSSDQTHYLAAEAVNGAKSYGDTVSNAFSAPTRDGYTFGGWYREALCLDVWNFASYLTVSNGLTQKGDGTFALNLYAKWTPNFIAITYDLNGSSDPYTPTAGSTAALFNHKVGSTVASPELAVKPADPIRAGYTFVGWFDTREKAQAPASNIPWNFLTNNITTPTSGTKTFYAGWVTNTHQVVYEYSGTVPNGAPNPGVLKMDKVAVGSAVTRAAAPTLAGYTFSGWSTTDATLTGNTFSMPDKNVVFRGTWTANTFNITYVYEGDVPTQATPLPSSETGVAFATAKTMAPIPAISGYTFSGWQTSDVVVTNHQYTMPNNNVTFKGSFVANPSNYVVSQFHVDENGVAKRFRQDMFSGNTGALATAVPYTSLTGYTFDQNHPETISSGIIAGDNSLELKLYYRINSNTITYSYQGNVPANAPEAPQGSQGIFGSKQAVADKPTLAGYTFNGWSTMSAGVSVSNNAYTMPDNTVAFSGTWAAKSVHVIFDANSGVNGNTTSVTAPYNSTLGTSLPTASPDIPTKDGYVFDGWSLITGENGSAQRFASSTPLRDGNGVVGATTNDPTLILYAVWKPAPEPPVEPKPPVEPDPPVEPEPPVSPPTNPPVNPPANPPSNNISILPYPPVVYVTTGPSSPIINTTAQPAPSAPEVEEPAEAAPITPVVIASYPEKLIPDEYMPLTDRVNSWALINLILCILGALLALGAIIAALVRSRRESGNIEAAKDRDKRKEQMLKEYAASGLGAGETQYLNSSFARGEKTEEEKEKAKRKKNRGAWLALAIIAAIIGVIVFILTEDMSLPMELVDWWTLLNAILFLLAILGVALAFKKKSKREEDEDRKEATYSSPQSASAY